LCGGAASLEIQDRSLPLHEGDLAVVGSTLYHRFECRSEPPVTLAVLFFQPDLIRADGGPDNAEYLTPFLLQDPQIPHLASSRENVGRGRHTLAGQPVQAPEQHQIKLPGTRIGKHPLKVGPFGRSAGLVVHVLAGNLPALLPALLPECNQLVFGFLAPVLRRDASVQRQPAVV
jgi:hypothetical protein